MAIVIKDAAHVIVQNNMSKSILLNINFWEAKQLEYWLKDNYPDCTIKPVNHDLYVPPEEHEYYRVEGKIDVDLSCILQLKYGLSDNHLNHGKN